MVRCGNREKSVQRIICAMNSDYPVEVGGLLQQVAISLVGISKVSDISAVSYSMNIREAALMPRVFGFVCVVESTVAWIPYLKPSTAPLDLQR